MTKEEAIERIKARFDKWALDDKDLDAIQTIIPELKESEDERIRKCIRLCLDECVHSDIVRDYERDECIAYLEKQKEQVPYIDFVIKPHKGDDNNPYDMRVSEAQEYAIKRGFGIPFNDGEVYVDERHLTQTIGNILRWADEHPKEQKEQKPAECIPDSVKFEEGFKTGRELGFREGVESVKPAEKQDYSGLNDLERVILRGFLAAGIENVPVGIIKDTASECISSFALIEPNSAEWSENFDKEVEKIHKRYPEVSFAKLTRIAYHFSKWASGYKDIEWSEEDEKIIQSLILEVNKYVFFAGIEANKIVSFLKSLRPSWKPSEEQIGALERAIVKMHTANDIGLLAELRDNLKKL